MPGWAQLTVAGIIGLTLALSGIAIFIRYGGQGLALVGFLAVGMVVCSLVEGLGELLLGRLLNLLFRGKPGRKEGAHPPDGDA